MTFDELLTLCYRVDHALEFPEVTRDILAWEHTNPALRLAFTLEIKLLLNAKAQTMEEQHARWMLTAMKRGWRHGACLNYGAKRSPRLVPYELLDKTSQLRLAALRAIVESCRAHVLPQPILLQEDVLTEDDAV